MILIFIFTLLISQSTLGTLPPLMSWPDPNMHYPIFIDNCLCAWALCSLELCCRDIEDIYLNDFCSNPCWWMVVGFVGTTIVPSTITHCCISPYIESALVTTFSALHLPPTITQYACCNPFNSFKSNHCWGLIWTTHRAAHCVRANREFFQSMNETFCPNWQNTQELLTNDEGITCSICLENFSDGDVVYRVGCCNNYFHQPCLDQWSGRCPLCAAAPSNSQRVQGAIRFSV